MTNQHRCFSWYTQHKVARITDDGFKTTLKIGPFIIGYYIMDLDEVDNDFYHIAPFWFWLWKRIARQ